jgi:regulator of sigma E protease
VISSTEIYYPPLWQRPFYGAYWGFKEAIFWGAVIFGGLGQILRSILGGSIPQGVAGPVGIYAMTSKAASFGILALINFMGILSVNLAFINIMPFPALDGGRFLFIIIEAVTRKKVAPRIESAIHMVGIILLLALVFAITAKDIGGLISAGSISGFLDSLVK